MSERKWNKGRPPNIGWWNASRCDDLSAWRWWNGATWSEVSYQYRGAISASKAAKKPVTYFDDDIRWTDYWPENARVPRIAP